MINYTQITIYGKKVGLKFGMLASQLFYEVIEKGKKVMMGDTVNELGITYLLWFGYLNNCEVKQVEPEMTFEDFYNFVESNIEDPDGQIKSAMDVWASSKPVQKAMEAADEAKKKSTGVILSE